MDTKAILRRFLQERSILARLEHPGIVRLLDGGMSPDGRPWYAMAHVEGEPVIGHANRQHLTVRQRIALVADIADAVACAHAQLVVHRDLKPGNILVDAEGQPHLLDFGIAKLLEETGDPTLTGTGMRILSPAYAAPEQILGQPVTTATDVYALGVVLYQMLTGHLPHQRSSRDPARLAGELGRQTAVTRASQAIGRADAGDLRILYGSGGDRRRLARQLDGDLDLILAVALKPEPERRYRTMSAFAADLRAWLEGRPVAARPDSHGYRLRKFVRRHALGVVAGAVVLAALLVGLGAALWQAGVARAQAERAGLVKDFVISLFQESDPIARAQVQARSPRELVAVGVERANIQLRGDDELRLQVLADLGQLAFALGDVELAATTLQQVRVERQARERRSGVASAEISAHLAMVRSQLGDLDSAEQLIDEALPVLRAQLGESDLATAQAEGHLARLKLIRGNLDQALTLSRSVHARFAAQLGSDHPESLARLYAVGVVLEQMTRLEESDAVFAEVVERLEQTLGPDHARLVRPLSLRGDVARRQERHADAIPKFERAIAIARLHFGDSHPILGSQLSRYADTLRRIGQYDAAAEALDQAARCFPPGSPEAVQVWFHRGQLHRSRDQPDQAIAALETAHAMFLATFGEDSAISWASLATAADIRIDQGQFDQAGPDLERVLRRMQAIAGDDSYDYAWAAQVLGRLRRLQQRADEAVILHTRGTAIMERLYGADNGNTGVARFELAQSLRAAGELVRARSELDRVLASVLADTTSARQHAAMRLESAWLAQAEGDAERQRDEAAVALRLADGDGPGDQRIRGEAAALVSSASPR